MVAKTDRRPWTIAAHAGTVLHACNDESSLHACRSVVLAPFPVQSMKGTCILEVPEGISPVSDSMIKKLFEVGRVFSIRNEDTVTFWDVARGHA